MSKKSAGLQTKETTFTKPDLYSCIIFRIADIEGQADGNVINVLKAHRDEVLANNPFGKKIVEDYYQATSKWVDALESSSDSKGIAKRAWTMLEGVARDIEAKKHDEATKKFAAFTAYVNSL